MAVFLPFSIPKVRHRWPDRCSRISPLSGSHPPPAGKRLLMGKESISHVTLHLPQVRTETYRSSFEFQGALEYNQLPQIICCTSSLQSFKHALRIIISINWTHYLLVNLCIRVPLCVLYNAGPAWKPTLVSFAALLFQIIYLYIYLFIYPNITLLHFVRCDNRC